MSLVHKMSMTTFPMIPMVTMAHPFSQIPMSLVPWIFLVCLGMCHCPDHHNSLRHHFEWYYCQAKNHQKMIFGIIWSPFCLQSFLIVLLFGKPRDQLFQLMVFFLVIENPNTIWDDIIAFFREMLKNTIPCNTTSQVFWDWLDHCATTKQLTDMYSYVYDKLPLSNGYISAFYPGMSFLTLSHMNTEILGSLGQAKNAIFYFIPYMKKHLQFYKIVCIMWPIPKCNQLLQTVGCLLEPWNI